MVTHEPALAARAKRNIHVRDGCVSEAEEVTPAAVQTA
jgi:predicted ABC-type transport system involved in lysophospholipase L1 biosynthesis ATPase subunit